MAISAGDLANMRAGQQSVIPHLNVVPPVVIGTGRINQSTFSYPLGELTLDTLNFNGGITLSTVPVGSMVYIGTSPGARDVAITTVRANGSATKLYITGMARGDPGVAARKPIALADNQYVTIYAFKPLWAQLSRIAGGAFYKAFDVAYTDEGSNPSPVANVGKWRRVALSGASVSVDFSATNSFAWGSKTISSYQWSFRNSSYALNTGGSFVGASTNSTATIDFDTAGFYIVYCQVTDSGGKTHTAETYVWVVDGVNEVDLAGWRLDEWTSDRQGSRARLTMYGDVAENVVFPGAAFLYSETSVFNGTTVGDGAVIDTFVGYIDEERGIRNVGYGKVEFDLLGPAGVLDKIAMAPQYIIEDASPADWTEVSSDLSNHSGVAWYILQHHAPNFLKTHDIFRLVDPSSGSLDTSYRGRVWALTGSSVWAQLQELGGDQVNIGCVSHGALYIRHKPWLMDTTDRDALDIVMTWGAGDIREELEYPWSFRLETGLVDVYAFSWDGTTRQPYWGRAPGDYQAQGKSKRQYNGLIVPAATAIADLKRISGDLLAYANNPQRRVLIKAMRNFDTAEPALMVWHKLDIGASYDPRGNGFSNVRVVPDQVTRMWEQSQGGTWLKRVEIVFEAETDGQDGIAKAVETAREGQWFPSGEWPDLVGIGVETYDPPREITEGTTVPTEIYAWHAEGPRVARATTADDWGSSPNWEDISTGLSGSCRWATADPFNYRRYFTVTSDGLFRCEDITATAPTWSQVLDNSLLPNGYDWHSIVMSINRQGWMMLLAEQYYAAVSFDYGNNWQVTKTGSGTSSAYRAIAAISPYSSPDDSIIYLQIAKLFQVSTDWGLTWSTRFNFQTGLFDIFNTGTIVVPYKKPGGEPNSDHSNQHVWVQLGQRGGGGSATPIAKSTNSGSSWTTYYSGAVAGDPAGWPSPSQRNIVAYTQDGNHVGWLTRKQGVLSYDSRCYFFYTENAAGPFTQAPNSPYTGAQTVEYVFLNGFPYNSNFYLAGGHWVSDGFLKLTKDKGASPWIDLTGNLVTGGVFPNMRVVYAEAGLAAYT